jgi:hypothetical protein
MLTCYVCVFSLRRESSDMILGDKPLLFQGGLSQWAGEERGRRGAQVCGLSWASWRGPA